MNNEVAGDRFPLAGKVEADVPSRPEGKSCGDRLIYSVISRMIRHGFPAANTPSGMSLVTTLPAPMTALEPIFTPGQITAPPPTHTSDPISMGLAYSCLRRSSA